MSYPAIYLDYTEETPREYKSKGILLERTKEYRAGDYLDVEIFPMLAMDRKEAEARRAKQKEKQDRANIRRARKMFERTMNANFGPGDYIFKLADTKAQDEKEARRHFQNFIRRMQYRARKAEIVFKAIWVLEETSGGVYHFHGVMTGKGWISRDVIEDMWEWEELPRIERVKNLDGGLAGFSRYITKPKSTQRRMMAHKWSGTRNLTKVEPRIKDKKFSKRAMMALATGAESDAGALFHTKYPGYQLIEQPEVYWSDFLPGAYIYARMKKIGA